MNRAFHDLLVCPYSRSPLALEAFESQGDEVHFGLFRSEAGEFPIVAGIPILFLGKSELITLLKTGRYKEALTLAMIGPAPSKGIKNWTEVFQDSQWLHSFGAWLDEHRQTSWMNQAAKAFFPANGTSLSPHEMFELAYGKYQIKKPSFANYNFYRFSSPSYLVALSFVQTLEKAKGLTLDLGCGAGHVTWAIQRRVPPQATIGLDRSFFALYIARTFLVPDVGLVCGDATALPFPAGLFSGVFSSDAFYFFPNKWGSMKEIERVLSDSGQLILTGLRNKLTAHKPVGCPLTPHGYRQLVAHLSARLIPDTLTTHRYLDGYGVQATVQVDDPTLEEAFALSIWATKGKEEFADGGSFSSWPHAEGALSVNPLYTPGRTNSAGTVYLRKWPLDAYTNINPQVKSYLPELFRLTSHQSTTLKKNVMNGLEDLIGRCAIMGFPPGYLNENLNSCVH